MAALGEDVHAEAVLGLGVGRLGGPGVGGGEGVGGLVGGGWLGTETARLNTLALPPSVFPSPVAGGRVAHYSHRLVRSLRSVRSLVSWLHRISALSCCVHYLPTATEVYDALVKFLINVTNTAMTMAY